MCLYWVFELEISCIKFICDRDGLRYSRKLMVYPGKDRIMVKGLGKWK